MTAAHKDAPAISGRVRVATKYVTIAQQYFASLGVQAEIIKLYGSMELAPLVGLADCIVDLVDTGNTLRANNLEPRELIMNISSRLVVNKASMKMKNAVIADLLAQFEQVLVENKS
jgi:ATP phosphoribosyltransferase